MAYQFATGIVSGLSIRTDGVENRYLNGLVAVVFSDQGVFGTSISGVGQ